MQAHRVRALAAAAALCLLAGGCAGRPEGVLLPMGVQAEGTARVDLLVATTRSDVGIEPGVVFGGERSAKINFADIAVSIPIAGGRAPGEVQWPAKMPPDPTREFATISVKRIQQAEAMSHFHGRLAKTRHRNVLLFVHGYNTRFEEAVYRLAQIAHDTKAPALPILFTWPSRGSLMGYTYDRESSNYSRDALESVLQTLAKDPQVGEVTVLAHSMGNWVTLEALRQMAIRNGRISTKIKSVMLAAPDVDIDVFRRQIEMIGDKRPPFTLLVSQDDKALAVSRRVWGGAVRLGAIDPKQEPLRSHLERSNIRVVDLSEQTGADSMNHGKFASSPLVARMIGGQLAAGQTLSDSQSGFGEKLGMVATGAAAAVGRAASIAISAPVSIVDGRTRETLRDQVYDLGEQINNTVSSASAVPASR
jgi:esterase/lipase superfamily enzyme